MTGVHRLRYLALGVIASLLVASPAGAAVGAKGGGTGDAEWIGSRTTDDGVTLRVTATEVDRTEVMPGFDLPDDCFADRVVTVGVSTDRLAQTVAAVFRRDGDAIQVQAPSTSDYAMFPMSRPEDQPVVDVVIVRAPKGAATVDARAVGWSDEAPVDGGYAVLARTGDGTSSRSPRRRLVHVTARDADGDVVGRAAQRFGRATNQLVDTSREECQPRSPGNVVGSPPPTQPLPEPVGSPPADEDAARAAITAAFEGAYPQDGDIERALSNVDGGDSAIVRDARQRAADANPQYVGRVTTVVNEIRFLDEREAAVRFEFRLDGQPFYSPQIGIALLTPTGWKMSRSTYCAQLASAGANARC